MGPPGGGSSSSYNRYSDPREIENLMARGGTKGQKGEKGVQGMPGTTTIVQQHIRVNS